MNDDFPMRGALAKRGTVMQEGVWFAVPLRDTEGFATGLLARFDGKGRALGYFFGPRTPVPPSREPLENLEARSAILVARFGDLHLIKGRWPLIGLTARWRRNEWPVPLFARIDRDSNRAWLVTYSDDSLGFVHEQPCEPEAAAGLPPDQLYGAGATELTLTRLLAAAGD